MGTRSLQVGNTQVVFRGKRLGLLPDVKLGADIILVSYPLPFKCSIKPRSPQALELVRVAFRLYHN
jgi:hypothetical protein